MHLARRPDGIMVRGQRLDRRAPRRRISEMARDMNGSLRTRKLSERRNF